MVFNCSLCVDLLFVTGRGKQYYLFWNFGYKSRGDLSYPSTMIYSVPMFSVECSCLHNFRFWCGSATCNTVGWACSDRVYWNNVLNFSRCFSLHFLYSYYNRYTRKFLAWFSAPGSPLAPGSQVTGPPTQSAQIKCQGDMPRAEGRTLLLMG